MNLDEMRLDCSIKQKKGLHFILASIIIWSIVAGIHFTSLPILSKNFLTFCFTAPLMPLAYMISKIIKVDFSNISNPLTKLGLLFSLNQMLYLLIAMWVYPTVPEKLVMIIAMIFGAHLLPYGWLYQSKSYLLMAVIIPIIALVIGMNFQAYILAGMMVLVELIFSLLLIFELKKLAKESPDRVAV